jgi:hypothetical protein
MRHHRVACPRAATRAAPSPCTVAHATPAHPHYHPPVLPCPAAPPPLCHHLMTVQLPQSTSQFEPEHAAAPLRLHGLGVVVSGEAHGWWESHTLHCTGLLSPCHRRKGLSLERVVHRPGVVVGGKARRWWLLHTSGYHAARPIIAVVERERVWVLNVSCGPVGVLARRCILCAKHLACRTQIDRSYEKIMTLRQHQ